MKTFKKKRDNELIEKLIERIKMDKTPELNTEQYTIYTIKYHLGDDNIIVCSPDISNPYIMLNDHKLEVKYTLLEKLYKYLCDVLTKEYEQIRLNDLSDFKKKHNL